METLPFNLSATRYAQILVQRHSDIGFVIAAVKRDFGRAPSRKAVEAMRAKYMQASAPKPETFNCGHARSFENTMLDGAYERCRHCRRKLERQASRKYREKAA